ncbi:MAG: hypothetical protein EOP54_21185 [Sphingobacteriales bacterium]|nr:MAG: hypothetical protein EOP54_21185 [Sphingobacteriales bacterium]
MTNRDKYEIYSAESSSNTLVDFFKEKYHAAVAAELRIRNLLSQLKGESEDATLFQFFKTENLEAMGYGVAMPQNTELLQR